MAYQYPPCKKDRNALAKYIVEDLKINPLTELLPMLEGAHKIKTLNGMTTIGLLTFPESIVNCDQPVQLCEVNFSFLALNCLIIFAPAHVVAFFLQAEHFSKPSNSLVAHMWNQMAYLIIAPEPVCTALTCARPDIIATVKILYGKWLYFCRSPQSISKVLMQLIATTWHVQSGSPACIELVKLIHSAQIAAVHTKHTATADIVVDNRAGIIISRRDKCLAALVFSCGSNRSLFQKHVQAFKNAFDDTPEALEELKHGGHPLDSVDGSNVSTSPSNFTND